MLSKPWIFACAVLVAGLMFCAESQARGSFYIGLESGRSEAQASAAAFESLFTNPFIPSVQPLSSSLDQTDTPIGVYVGYELSRNLGLEFEYLDLGKSAYKSTAPFGGPFSSGIVYREITNRTQALALTVSGRYPLKKNLHLTASAGLAAAKVDVDIDININDTPATVIISDDTSSSGYTILGVGVEWLAHPNWLLHLGAQRLINLDSGVSGLIQQVDMTLLTGGVAFRF